MEPEISPEPSEEEREALDEALAHLLAAREEPRSDWWRAGVSDALSPEEESA